MVAKFAFWTLKFRPRTPPIAFARSASTPTTVWPFVATNSIGAYVASEATTRVPFARIDCGTSAAIFGFFANPPEPQRALQTRGR